MLMTSSVDAGIDASSKDNMTFPFGKILDHRAAQERWLRGLFSLTIGGLVVLGCAGVKASCQTPAPRQPQRVLILYSDERLIPANIIVDQGIHEVFSGNTSKHIELYSEFLDVVRFPGEEERQLQRIFFREKYHARLPDLVIAVGGGALVFLTERRAELFAGVPVVYCSLMVVNGGKMRTKREQ